jgi:hypothetical protein
MISKALSKKIGLLNRFLRIMPRFLVISELDLKMFVLMRFSIIDLSLVGM